MRDVKDTRSTRAKINLGLTYAVMIFFTVMAIYPLLWLVMNSFKTTTEFQLNKLGIPQDWVLINYQDAWVRGKFPSLILNSIIYTGITTVATLIFSFMAGFAFAKIPNKATKY